jgi:hypothetical protein
LIGDLCSPYRHDAAESVPEVSQIRRYNLQNIPLERLMQALVSLDQHVEVIVRPARRAHEAGIKVTKLCDEAE